MKKKLSVILLLLLFLVSAVPFSCSEAIPSLIQRALAFLDYDHPLGFRFTIQVEKSPVYGEGRTEQLNRLLKHFSFDGTIHESLSELTVLLDQQKLFGISQINLSNQERISLSPADGDPFILPQMNDTETLLPSLQSATETYLREKSIFHSLYSYVSLISRLPDAFPEKTGSSKILEKYRYYGTATRRVTVNITGEELNDYILTHTSETRENEEMFPDLSGLVFENRQGFTLLFTEENQLIGITYSGKIRFPEEEDLREVRLDWKTVQNSVLEKNELTLRTPSSDRTRRDNYILDSQWALEEDGSEAFHWNAETDLLSDSVRTQRKVTSEWTAAGNHLSGTFSETDLSDRTHPARNYVVNADVSDLDEYNGTLEIIDKNDKIETSRLLVGFQVFPAITEPVSASQPEARTVSPEEYTEIRNSIESFILREMFKLPVEDLAFIREGLPETAWNQLLINE